MAVDPAASLRVWAVQFDLAGRVFEIPALPAADWLPLLASGDRLSVTDLLPDSEQLDELIVSGEITGEELGQAVDAAIEQGTGRPAHAAVLLAQLAYLGWARIGGELARTGFRWDRQPIGAALDAIRMIALAYISNRDTAERLVAVLDSDVAPVEAGSRRRRVDRQRALSDFEAMAGPPPTAAVTGPASAGPSGDAPPKTPPRSQPHRPADR